jgi:HD-like signal output (HDOD) protein
MAGYILWIADPAPVAQVELPEGWEIIQADPAGALQLNRTPELVITDLVQSPVVDEIARHFAHSIRVLAVPDCQDEQLLPFLQHYHLFCLQPVPQDSIPRLVNVAAALAALGLSASCRSQLLACSHLPLIPPIVGQLQQLLLDPDVRIDKLAELIEQDTVLSARLLQLANSAYMGFNQETYSVQMAISRLGLSLLYGVVLALSVSQDNDQSGGLAGVRLAGHCRHVGQWLALEQGAMEQMMLAALFYQLGQALLHTADGEVGALSPAQAGAFMLTLWGFAAPVANILLAQQSLQLAVKQPAALGLYLARSRQSLRVPEPALERVLLKLGLRQHWPTS